MQKNKSFNLNGLAATALLTAISLILARFAVMIPLFGYPSVRFSVSGIPVFLAGAIFGPLFGACAGFISDILSFMMTSGSPYHFGFTLNSILVGFIPGVVFWLIRSKKITYSFNKINTGLGILALVGSVIYINFVGIHEIETIGTVFGIPVNLILSGVMIAVIIGLIVVVKMVQKHFKGMNQMVPIDKIIFVAIINYVVIQLTLTPIWLNQLYGLPVGLSVFARVFKSIIDIPLQVSLIYMVMSALPVAVKRTILWKA